MSTTYDLNQIADDLGTPPELVATLMRAVTGAARASTAYDRGAQSADEVDAANQAVVDATDALMGAVK